MSLIVPDGEARLWSRHGVVSQFVVVNEHNDWFYCHSVPGRVSDSEHDRGTFLVYGTKHTVHAATVKTAAKRCSGYVTYTGFA